METTFNRLAAIITAANPDYKVEDNENAMSQVSAGNYAGGTRYVYAEEHLEGSYTQKYFPKRETRARLWFCKFSPTATTAADRRRMRAELEEEIVRPFIERFTRQAPTASSSTEFRFELPPPRFDENEAAIVLEFSVESLIGCPATKRG